MSESDLEGEVQRLRQRLAALEAHAQRGDRFFAMSRDLLCIAGFDGHIERANPAMLETLGVEEAVLRGQPFMELVHPDDRPAAVDALQQLAAGQRLEDIEVRFRGAGGSYRLLSWHAIPDTERERIYAVGRDITDARAIEAQGRQAQKMDAVGQLAGGVAHDFNNLVLAIMGNIEFAIESLDRGHPAHEHVMEIQRAAERAAQLTRQLMAFSRHRPLRAVDMDVNELAQELLVLLRRLIPEDIELDFVPSQKLAAIHADPGQLEQVMMNLCLNARDAMPRGGRITIETENVLINGAYRESRPWAKPGRYVLLSVSDQGVGMDAAVRERIFEPFFTTKEPGQGTGLGLATVYGIVKQHSGFVQVYSEPGEGTAFKVYLPVSTRAAADVGPKIVRPPGGGRETILLAEDEPAVRKVVVKILERAGYAVLAAQDGLEAVRLLQEHEGPVALALLDMVMPRLSGPEAHARIQEVRPGLPVLFSSGYSDAERFRNVLPPDAKVLHKPYGSDALLGHVREILDGP